MIVRVSLNGAGPIPAMSEGSERAMERIVEFSPAYDKRDPIPSKNYGIHGVDLRMVLKGERGAVQFVLYTDWQLPHVAAEYKAKGFHIGPLPADLGFHSPVPMYDGDESIEPECAYLDGRPCFYDGSGLAADRIFNVLRAEGGDGVWRELEAYYTEVFSELV